MQTPIHRAARSLLSFSVVASTHLGEVRTCTYTYSHSRRWLPRPANPLVCCLLSHSLSFSLSLLLRVCKFLPRLCMALGRRFGAARYHINCRLNGTISSSAAPSARSAMEKASEELGRNERAHGQGETEWDAREGERERECVRERFNFLRNSLAFEIQPRAWRKDRG